MKRFFSIISMMIVVLAASAQISVKSTLDSTQILVGSQTRLVVSVDGVSESENIVFPSFKDNTEMAPGLEVVESYQDTTSQGQQKVYVLTAWDEGKYNVPSLKVKVGGRAFSTNSIPLKVNTIKVDTAHADSIRPMRGVADNPYSWDEWSPLLILSIVALLLFVVVYYLYVRLRDNKPIIARVRLVKKLLPHEKALKSIERIKTEHLADSGNQKEYYTELTDTLRQYLEDRFGIRAKEMTSSEIIDRLQREEDQSKIDELKEVFETADLVKFAKYMVQNNVNDAYMVSVVKFIDGTKQEDAPTVEKIGTKLSAKDKRKMQTRKGVRLSIAALIIIAVAMIAYVVWRVVEIVG